MELLAFTYAATVYDPETVESVNPWNALYFPLQPALMSGFLTAITLASLLSVGMDAANAALEPGDVGPTVESLQSALIKADYYRGAATGYYGALTRDAVIQFQRDRGLFDDGVAGAETLQALSLDPNLDAAVSIASFSTSAGGGGGGGTPDASSDTPALNTAGGSLQRAVVETNSGIGLNVRNSPAGERVDGKPDGDPVNYQPNSARLVTGWYRGDYTWVQLADGNWVASDYLTNRSTVVGGSGGSSSGGSGGGSSTLTYQVVDQRGANIYDRPNGAIVGFVPSGQTVTIARDNVFSSGQFWSELTGNRGWVAKSGLSQTTAGGGGGNSDRSATITASALVVRNAPAGSDTGRTLYGGDRVQLTGVTTLAANQRWSQLSDGTWVATDYLDPS